jgi:hypothetical protein
VKVAHFSQNQLIQMMWMQPLDAIAIIAVIR